MRVKDAEKVLLKTVANQAANEVIEDIKHFIPSSDAVHVHLKKETKKGIFKATISFRNGNHQLVATKTGNSLKETIFKAKQAVFRQWEKMVHHHHWNRASIRRYIPT